jgi:hypothetical protein
MRTSFLCWTVVAGALFATELMAQPEMPVIPVSFQQDTTTGMIGFTLNQTARLSVLNLNAVPATANAPANCTVELQFFDPQNNVLGQKTVPNFAPQTATWLDLDRKSVTAQTAPRAQIRGVVIVNPTPSAASASPVAVGFCTVAVTLEIFDNTTGSTVAMTSETHSTGVGVGVFLQRMMR